MLFASPIPDNVIEVAVVWLSPMGAVSGKNELMIGGGGGGGDAAPKSVAEKLLIA